MILPLLAEGVAGVPWWVTTILAPTAMAASGAVGWLWRDERAQRNKAQADLAAAQIAHAAQLVVVNDARLADRAACETARIAEHERHREEMKDLLESAVARSESTEATLARFEQLLKGGRRGTT